MMFMKNFCAKLRTMNNMVKKNAVSVRKLVNPNMYVAVAHLSDGSFVSSKFFVTSSHHKNEIYVSFK
jgi:hypothetical protein